MNIYINEGMFPNLCSYSLQSQFKYRDLPFLKQNSIVELFKFRFEFILIIRKFYAESSLLVTISVF